MATKHYLCSLICMLTLFIPALLSAQAPTSNMKSAPRGEMQLPPPGGNAMTPMEIAEDSVWLHYDDIENYDAWGFLISGEEYDVVAKWDAADISNYDEWVITKVKFIVVNPQPYLTVKIWEGPNTTEVYSQEVDSYNVNDWTEVILDTPHTIDGTTELWVGYYVDMTHTELGGFVTATDDGPPEDEYGNLYRWNGTWYSDFNNHNLRVLIEPNLNADFEADNTVICYGSTVNFTNLSTSEESYSWTFEGGTPSSSTDENPSVVYDTPGVYDVTLEVSFGDETDTETKQDYIVVLDTPGQADEPAGDEEVCTGQSYEYATLQVLYAQDYEWELDPPDAGVLTPEDTAAVLLVADDWTGDFTLRVRATNICGDGDWSEAFEGTAYASPAFFNLEGGGGYCLNGDGAEITLDGSETGVDYALYLDGEATGIEVEGTGSEISFGLLTEEGFYEAYAINDNCEAKMNNQVEVEVLFPPLEPEEPTGPETICEETTTDYASEGTDDADSYVWLLEPEEAGSIAWEDLQATITWNGDFTGTAYVSLYGVNECGDGNPSGALEISVGSPAPEVSGEDLVCDWSEEMYEVAFHEGSTYTWQVVGGTLTDGQGTHMVTISWEGEGAGTIGVTEVTAGGCEGAAEEFDVTIDDCTAIGDPASIRSLSVYPNPASGGEITVKTGTAETVAFTIYAISGEKVIETHSDGPGSVLDISRLQNGIYLLKVSYPWGTTEVVRFMKE